LKKLAVRIDPGYTQMSNRITDDDGLAVVDMGMLLKLHRCVDGYDVTVQSIADKHSDPSRRGTGYTALEASMRHIVRRGYVVKIKYQNEAGHWHTVFAPFHQPATPGHVAAMLDAIEEPVTAYRVEPAWLDTREDADTKPDLRKHPRVGVGATDSALSGSRSAGSRPETSSIRTEDGTDQTNDHTNRPSRPSPTRASSATGQQGPEGSGDGKPTRKPRKAASGPAASPSAGVTLLVEIGRQIPALAFSGPWLTAQGKRLDDLLAAGWTAGQLHTLLTASLPDVVERPAGLIRRRIDDIPAAPELLPLGRVPEQRDSDTAALWDGPRVGLAHADWQTPSSTKAAARTVTEAVQRRDRPECDGRDGQCGRPVPVPGALCPACRSDGPR
jgi:hypothetical protein